MAKKLSQKELEQRQYDKEWKKYITKLENKKNKLEAKGFRVSKDYIPDKPKIRNKTSLRNLKELVDSKNYKKVSYRNIEGKLYRGEKAKEEQQREERKANAIQRAIKKLQNTVKKIIQPKVEQGTYNEPETTLRPKDETSKPSSEPLYTNYQGMTVDLKTGEVREDIKFIPKLGFVDTTTGELVQEYKLPETSTQNQNFDEDDDNYPQADLLENLKSDIEAKFGGIINELNNIPRERFVGRNKLRYYGDKLDSVYRAIVDKLNSLTSVSDASQYYDYLMDNYADIMDALDAADLHYNDPDGFSGYINEAIDLISNHNASVYSENDNDYGMTYSE